MKRLAFALTCLTATLVVLPSLASAERAPQANQVRGQLKSSTGALNRAVQAIGPKLRALKTAAGTRSAAPKVRAAIAAIRNAQAQNAKVQVAFSRAASILGPNASPANAGLNKSNALQSGLTALIAGLESQDNLRDIALQSMMSRYAQAAQILTELLKLQHDTYKSIIGNMR